MKTYAVDIWWNHKGSKYPKEAHVRVKGTSLAIAANKAIRHVRTMNKASWREPVGAHIAVNICIIDNGKEADDGRRVRDEQVQEP